MNELKIKKILREFSKKRDWDQFHSLKNLAISINLESSELLEIFQWEKDDSEFYKKKEKGRFWPLCVPLRRFFFWDNKKNFFF